MNTEISAAGGDYTQLPSINPAVVVKLEEDTKEGVLGSNVGDIFRPCLPTASHHDFLHDEKFAPDEKFATQSDSTRVDLSPSGSHKSSTTGSGGDFDIPLSQMHETHMDIGGPDHLAFSQPPVAPVAPQRARLVSQASTVSAVSAASNCSNNSRRRSTRTCVHGKQAYSCRECGGAAFCEHGRVRRRCVLCGGSGVCQHRRRKERCRECGGKQVCLHGKRKQDCRDCGGSAICQHRHVRRRCRECWELAKCRHGNRLRLCGLCQQSGIFICEHLRERSACRECGGHALCLPHGKEVRHCRECKGLPPRQTPAIVSPPNPHFRQYAQQTVHLGFNTQQQRSQSSDMAAPSCSHTAGTAEEMGASETTASTAFPPDSGCQFGIPEDTSVSGVDHHFAPSSLSIVRTSSAMVGGHASSSSSAYTLPELQRAATHHGGGYDDVAAASSFCAPGTYTGPRVRVPVSAPSPHMQTAAGVGSMGVGWDDPATQHAPLSLHGLHMPGDDEVFPGRLDQGGDDWFLRGTGSSADEIMSPLHPFDSVGDSSTGLYTNPSHSLFTGSSPDDDMSFTGFLDHDSVSGGDALSCHHGGLDCHHHMGAGGDMVMGVGAESFLRTHCASPSVRPLSADDPHSQHAHADRMHGFFGASPTAQQQQGEVECGFGSLGFPDLGGETEVDAVGGPEDLLS
uniref:Uncharacterized protein n=1 Tax=Chromera velia CCMP2878 TaxID=1169474 RepID=A0A0G4F317_9ALVE|eukprot:Cvel_14779.t1-p1 / transcript=Cvel_14779.t1 / gene=Cvel_14779 / organism=Chromera_velia_CCMP2878 / gene_product=hypothetical protein / transcript_product=hypothetical protein / location=Cvel_scaffold1064:36278-38670(-) / protein_length=680 / sequence_SO=supercontig / SO=protein_coding / is_pseudo=false